MEKGNDGDVSKTIRFGDECRAVDVSKEGDQLVPARHLPYSHLRLHHGEGHHVESSRRRRSLLSELGGGVLDGPVRGATKARGD